MSRRGGSSGRWRARQEKDPYVERASAEGWRARSVFKLIEVQKRAGILKPGMLCVDLGASPGSWSQFAATVVGDRGAVVAVDILPMAPIPGVDFVEGDFTSEDVRGDVLAALGGRRVSLVMSDMAPNISGNRVVDQARSLELAVEALRFAEATLARSGDFFVKLFQGEGVDEFTREAGTHFTKVRTSKPRASRSESREIYLLARNFRM